MSTDELMLADEMPTIERGVGTDEEGSVVKDNGKAKVQQDIKVQDEVQDNAEDEMDASKKGIAARKAKRRLKAELERKPNSEAEAGHAAHLATAAENQSTSKDTTAGSRLEQSPLAPSDPPPVYNRYYCPGGATVNIKRRNLSRSGIGGRPASALEYRSRRIKS